MKDRVAGAADSFTGSPSFGDVVAAAARIAGHVRRTPVMTSRTLDEMVGSEVLMKCENLQGGGAFKLRGATNAVLCLNDDQARRGVAAHSSGNHAGALALAASRRGIPAHLVMPSDVTAAKKAAVEGYGGRVVLCEATLAAREATVAQVVAETGATEVHPYDNPWVIAGAGTATLELLAEAGPLDGVVAPVSGGGLLSGTALAAHGAQPGIRVVGAEPLLADDAARSLAAGRRLDAGPGPTTMADGLLATLSDRTFAILRDTVDEIVTVTEDQIVEAMRLLWERMKLVVEPAGAVPIAALLARPGAWPPRVGVIASGGNVDLDRLPF